MIVRYACVPFRHSITHQYYLLGCLSTGETRIVLNLCNIACSTKDNTFSILFFKSTYFINSNKLTQHPPFDSINRIQWTKGKIPKWTRLVWPFPSFCSYALAIFAAINTQSVQIDQSIQAHTNIPPVSSVEEKSHSWPFHELDRNKNLVNTLSRFSIKSNELKIDKNKLRI